MRERVRAVLARVLDVDVAELPEEPTPDALESWDSLHHMELMLKLEDEFGIEVDPELAPSLVSLTALADFVERQLAPAASGAGGSAGPRA